VLVVPSTLLEAELGFIIGISMVGAGRIVSSVVRLTRDQHVPRDIALTDKVYLPDVTLIFLPNVLGIKFVSPQYVVRMNSNHVDWQLSSLRLNAAADANASSLEQAGNVLRRLFTGDNM
jgi:hypothetical protein